MYPRQPQALPTVCQVLHTMVVGGAEVLAARLARQLCESYRFVFVCLDDLGKLGEELRKDGFPVHVLGRRPGLDWRCAWRLGRLLRREQVALIHAHQYTPFLYALLARIVYRRPPILFLEHGRHYPDQPRRKRRIANRLLPRRSDRIVAVGEAVRQALIDIEGFPPERVARIYNGIDLSAYEDNNLQRQQTRRDLGAESEDVLIALVARLDYLKDHATAIRTMARLAPRCPRAKLLLVGEGPQRPHIEEAIRALNVSTQVQLLGYRRDIPQVLAAADIFLLTSISEGIPLTVIEAMAAGLPVVATRVGGLAEVVEEGRSGWLVPTGDDAALAEALEKLARDPAKRAEMGKQGRTRALDLFSESRMVAEYDALYRRMLDAVGTPHA
ncbi:MAG TPA: GT4 family glycosyltransferase PelF [Gemmataceae bacterium]|nr:GT4 family glycosyltransferase PelF [Gemmataceae bacterium]